MSAPPSPPRLIPEPPATFGSADVFDYALLKDYARFAFGALRRHRLTAGISFALVFGSALLGLAVLPKSYHTEVKILAERNLLMPALDNPTRAIPGEADAPTRAATERVLRHDNLVSLVKQTDLVAQWDATRAPASRAKDAISRLFSGPPDQDDKIDALVGLLEKRLRVDVGDGTVTIAIDWPNARMAFQLVEAAQQNFMETRHAMEVSTIAEAIAILEDHASSLNENINAELEELQHHHDARKEKDKSDAPAAVPAAPKAPARGAGLAESITNDQELARIHSMLVAKRRAIADLEDFRRKRLADLQGQLAEQRGTYGPAHPYIVTTEQSIAALQQESPQIASLRREEQELVQEYTRRSGKDPDSVGPAPVVPPRLSEISRLVHHAPPAAEEDDATEYARTRLNIAVAKYEDLLGRIDSARIELDTARAAFKYRYSIIRPAEVPKRPDKPNVPLTLFGGLIGGLALALVLCALIDILRDRIVEPWQLERSFGLAVLGDVDGR